VIYAQLEDDCAAILATQYIDGLLRNYIVLNNLTLGEAQKEEIKITGVHEFCHFMAILFAIMARSFDEARKRIMERLNNKVDQLKKNELDMLFSMLSKKEPPDYRTLELLTDSHFRLGFEGDVPDYIELFRHFMFSREIFELTFDEKKQIKFKKLFRTKDSKKIEEAVTLLSNSIETAAKEKSVPLIMAYHQVRRWVASYAQAFSNFSGILPV
ncbi:MAG: hypothetical protein EZS28_051773, partial [Streblomastix strix]